MNKKEIEALAKQVAKQVKSPEGIHDVLKAINKSLLEAVLEAELDEHVGYAKHQHSGASNSRNGHSKKTLRSDKGEFDIDVPRDRDGEFQPQIVKKHQSRIGSMDDKILYLYGQGLSTRELSAMLLELYDVEVSASLISRVTDAVIEDVIAWQARPIEPIYPIVYMDCIRVKIRQDKRVINKAIYLALGVNVEGHKELLGLWIAENEGAKFWLSVLTELQNRGLKDILIACVDGLKGFPDAIQSAFPDTHIQLCIVHMVRNSLKYVTWKDYKAVTSDLKAIYRAATEDKALQALDYFAQTWDDKYPQISKSWRTHWSNVNTLFGYPPDIRKAIYTTNAIESLNSVIRKAVKKRSVFPSDQAASKIIYLSTQQAMKKWTMPIRNWKPALNRFMIEFEERLTDYI